VLANALFDGMAIVKSAGAIRASADITFDVWFPGRHKPANTFYVDVRGSRV
jgi:hypothetical protein